MRKSVRRIKERFIETYTQVCGPLKERCEYLDYWNLDTGYMLSFNFNKKKEQGVFDLKTFRNNHNMLLVK